MKAKSDTTYSDYWIVGADYLHYIAENTGIGCGAGYHSEFKANDNSFLNIDVLLKQRFPLKKENINLYLMGGLGYGLLVGTNKGYISSEYWIKYEGGLHWLLACGIDINSFIVELSYSCNYIDIKTNHPYVSGDGSFCSVILSAGYKFDF